MNGRLPLLGALLIVQLVIIAAVFLLGDEESESAVLLEVEPELVTGLEIEDADGESILAVLTDDR
ncbi:MAG: hypothetical protein AAGE43_17390, partial [Pseudomonadota bacterium]